MIIKKFIVFEGIDGSGTTTQIKKLASLFPKESVVQTAEPTSSETGLFLRKMLKGDFSVSEKTAAYLFAADRCEHIYGKNGILFSCQNGKIVLSDRYIFSSLAYQSVTEEESLPKLLNSPFPLPEYLLYFKIDPEISLKRVTERGGTKEIYEKIDFQKKTAQNYEKIISEYQKQESAKSDGMKIITVDASKSIEETATFIKNALIKNGFSFENL